MCTYSITLNDQLVDQARTSFGSKSALDAWLQQQVEALLREYNRQTIVERARKAIDAMRVQSEQNGNSNLTLNDINEEIRQVRKARRAVAV